MGSQGSRGPIKRYCGPAIAVCRIDVRRIAARLAWPVLLAIQPKLLVHRQL